MRKNLVTIGIIVGLLIGFTVVNAQSSKFEAVAHPIDLPHWSNFFDNQSDLSEPEIKEAKEQLNTFIDKLQTKRTKYNHQSQFLKHLFYKVHQKYLSNYQPQASFSDLLASKKYDCLTGTALYAMILDGLEIDHKIVETEFHIFLLVQDDGSEILFETTDPFSGFVTDAGQIEKIINGFSRPSVQNEEAYYQFSFKIYNHIDLRELAGLHYYNQAVGYYNQQQIGPALINLESAFKLYPSPRLQEFKGLIEISASTK